MKNFKWTYISSSMRKWASWSR